VNEKDMARVGQQRHGGKSIGRPRSRIFFLLEKKTFASNICIIEEDGSGGETNQEIRSNGQ
jgi:hypothetical protein